MVCKRGASIFASSECLDFDLGKRLTIPLAKVRALAHKCLLKILLTIAYFPLEICNKFFFLTFNK